MSKFYKYIIGVAVTAIVLFLMWYFSNIVTYILISAVLAIVGKPLVEFVTKIKVRGVHLPKWFAAMVTLMTIWAFLILFFSLFIPIFFEKVNEFSSLQVSQLIDSFKGPLMSLQNFIERVFSIKEGEFSLTESLIKQISDVINIDFINRMLSSIVFVIGDTVIALFSISFITFFFLKEDHLFFDMVVAIFPPKYEQNITHALNSITKLLIRYFTGIVAESTIMMIVISTTLIIFGLGVKTAFFIGLVMGVLNVIPYIGPLIGACLSVLIGVLTPIYGFSTAEMGMVVAGTILFFKGIDDFVLQPLLYSNRVNAHPLEIFIVILIAGSVAGVFGMLLAIPSYTVLRVFAKEFFNHFSLVQKLTNKI